MPKRSSILAPVLCGLLAFVGAAHADSPRLRLEGSTTLLPAVQSLAEQFRAMHPDPVIEVHGGGSARGIDLLIAGRADIATSSRFLTEEELQRAVAAGAYPVPFRVAHDAVIPIVHKANPVDNLSLAQLRQVFAGEITNWEALGGPDREIVLVIRHAESGTEMVWRDFVPSPGADVSSVFEAGAGSAVVRLVADHRGAIGYIGLGNLDNNVRPLTVDGITGSVGNVRSGSYPLSRPLFFFTNGWPRGSTLEFIDYVLDPQGGQPVISQAGLIPVFALPQH